MSPAHDPRAFDGERVVEFLSASTEQRQRVRVRERAKRGERLVEQCFHDLLDAHLEGLFHAVVGGTDTR